MSNLSAMADRNAIMEEQQIMEMEKILAANLREAELKQDLEYPASCRERAKSEVDSALRAAGDLDLERWNQTAKIVF